MHVADINALGKIRVCAKGFPNIFYGRVLDVFNNYYSMGIAHGEGRELKIQFASINEQVSVVAVFLHIRIERNLSRNKIRLSHVYGDFSIFIGV